MVLLTHSTVSIILSTGVVSIFTFLLFLSGYALQQQSVRTIQNVIRPPEHPQVYKRSQDPLSDLDIEEDLEEPPQVHTKVTPGVEGNYAYLQLLSDPDPSNICSAMLLFKQLSTNNSAIHDRLFMYPSYWDTMTISKPVSTALSLLRDASLKYDIWLLPIDMSAATAAGYTATDTKLLRLGQIQFMQYDGVLYLQTPGLLLDSAKLDSMLLSRPLPLRHDKSRVESYNNEAWISMPLRAEQDANLPPVYLVTVNNIENGNIEARAHIPNLALEGFGRIVTGPWGVPADLDAEINPAEQPGYVFFQRDDEGHAKWENNPLFGSWRAQQSEICEGLDLDGTLDNDNDDDL
ncbi:uncharacterized protein DSM5745_07621 [Aspergillus mulundensis]|uniref:Uncharacterized protein n=1 Tax=Aspergillus mulundensis TaxID=1810919 RepID=A0A3D8REH4_9EURO|nr:Uncharacterized protein DSM5745_07621 [Aspergillus mulundensis]RDW72449.1 Uncharacterized protein DSM5745_07621 [Aspergillus mulundensis]